MGFDMGGTGGGTPPGFQSGALPASISSFSMEAYEVTIGRFRKFVNAFTQWRSVNPQSGAGGRVSMTPGAGWNPAWDADMSLSLPTTSTALVSAIKSSCNDYNMVSVTPDWTDQPGPNDGKPMTCVTWYEAFMFCIWDNARLPTEAEWEFAAAGAGQQRAYPWSMPPGDLTIPAGINIGNTGGDVVNVGSSPAGNGLYGHADLAGNAFEWVRDTESDLTSYPDIPDSGANDPVYIATETQTSRIVRGGSFDDGDFSARTSARTGLLSTARYNDTGFRCVRPASP
jgi:formylglycine-generating enzyme required for sulfatase activity